jgi:hypothetical protein
MALNDDKLRAIFRQELTATEREQGVLYELLDPLEAGSTLEFPQCTIHVAWDARLAFVDRQPLANWGHSCRYVLANATTGEVMSIEARFPPFLRNDQRRWVVAHQAPSVPDTALAVPK